MIDKSNPMDLVFMLALIHTVPLKALLWANFGASASDVRYKTRMTLIIGGLVAIWVSYAAVWHYNGFSPLRDAGLVDVRLWALRLRGRDHQLLGCHLAAARCLRHLLGRASASCQEAARQASGAQRRARSHFQHPALVKGEHPALAVEPLSRGCFHFQRYL